MEVMEALRGHTTALPVPHFMIDVPGGGGKIVRGILRDAVGRERHGVILPGGDPLKT
jgi:lysine 2,3-aminomutase